MIVNSFSPFNQTEFEMFFIEWTKISVSKNGKLVAIPRKNALIIAKSGSTHYWLRPAQYKYIINIIKSSSLDCYLTLCVGLRTLKTLKYTEGIGCTVITYGNVRGVYVIFIVFYSIFTISFHYFSHLLCLYSFRNHRSIILLFALGQFQMGAQRGTFAATIPTCTHT